MLWKNFEGEIFDSKEFTLVQYVAGNCYQYVADKYGRKLLHNK